MRQLDHPRAPGAVGPANAGWQRDLAISHGHVATIKARQGTRNEALSAFQQAGTSSRISHGSRRTMRHCAKTSHGSIAKSPHRRSEPVAKIKTYATPLPPHQSHNDSLA